MLNKVSDLGLRLNSAIDDRWQIVVRITFTLFVGCLLTLLVLLYGGVLLI
jgi:hypothetical protein